MLNNNTYVFFCQLLLENYLNDVGPFVDNLVLEVSPQGDMLRMTVDPIYSFFKIVIACYLRLIFIYCFSLDAEIFFEIIY